MRCDVSLASGKSDPKALPMSLTKRLSPSLKPALKGGSGSALIIGEKIGWCSVSAPLTPAFVVVADFRFALPRLLTCAFFLQDASDFE